MRRFIVLFAIFCLSSCNSQDMVAKFVSPQDQATARHYLDDLRARNISPVKAAIDPSLLTSSTESNLDNLSLKIPTQEPTSVKIVGAHFYGDANKKVISTTWEYQFGDKWLIADITIQDKAGTETIVGLHVIPLTQSLEEQNRFSLHNAGIGRYALLIAMALVVAITLIALIRCIRTQNLRRKWFWIIFILFGFTGITLNWTTGRWFFTPIYLQLFSAGAKAQFFGPWILTLSVPVGAIVFLVYGRRLGKPRDAQFELESQ
ncbi:MAG: hypothetical protein KGH91_03750 [Rhodospirillales bacterium]|nr:hypothetical protein [Rhodospirillales bacterium]